MRRPSEIASELVRSDNAKSPSIYAIRQCSWKVCRISSCTRGRGDRVCRTMARAAAFHRRRPSSYRACRLCVLPFVTPWRCTPDIVRLKADPTRRSTRRCSTSKGSTLSSGKALESSRNLGGHCAGESSCAHFARCKFRLLKMTAFEALGYLSAVEIARSMNAYLTWQRRL